MSWDTGCADHRPIASGFLTIDTLADGQIAAWRLTPDGAARTVQPYQPTLFVGDAVDDLYGAIGGPSPTPPTRDGLSPAPTELHELLTGQQTVADFRIESLGQTFRTDARPALRIDTVDPDAVRAIARRVQQFGAPNAYTCYHVDLSQQHRYCLETVTPAAPDRTACELLPVRGVYWWTDIGHTVCRVSLLAASGTVGQYRRIKSDIPAVVPAVIHRIQY